MIGIDTNVLVRFLVRDDEEQFQAAAAQMSALTPGSPGFVTDLVLAELYWVLTRAYRMSAATALDAITSLVGRVEIRVSEPGLVGRALNGARQGADLADALIAERCRAAGASEVITLDRRASEILGMRLI